MNKKEMKDIYSDARYDTRYDSRCKMYIQEAVALILDHKYGDTIEYETLAKVLHYNLEDEKEKSKFGSQMGRIKRFLIEYGYILKSIGGVGYYILKPKQISGYCYHTYIRRTQNLLEKSEEILKHVDLHEMSQIRKKEHKEVGQLNQDVKDSIYNTLKESEYEKNKNEYDSLND